MNYGRHTVKQNNGSAAHMYTLSPTHRNSIKEKEESLEKRRVCVKNL